MGHGTMIGRFVNRAVWCLHEKVQVDRLKLAKDRHHSLSAEEVEAAFERVYQFDERPDGSYQMYAEIPSGRRIWVIWRYDRDDETIPDILGDLDDPAIIVITAY